MSKITLCLTGETLDENKKYLKDNLSSIDIIELRIDCLKDKNINAIKSFLELCEKEVILTCRRSSDGGFFQKEEETQRLDLLDKLMALPFSYVDLEEDLSDKWSLKANSRGLKVIRSVHDFSGVPENCLARFKELKRKGIAKMALSLKTIEDYDRYFELLKKGDVEGHILLAMGLEGLFTRVLAPIWNIFLTYSSPSGSMAAAPGHITPQELLNLYRFRQIDKSTALFGIIGKKLGHSKSPQIHNAWFKESNSNAIYIAFPIPHIHVLDLLKKEINLKGLSITIPYKVEVISKADQCSERVKSIGACNTLYLQDNQWIGENTDAPGFLKPLLDFIHCSDLLDRKVTVIGAGGAARGILYALSEAGAKVLILNRTEEKAQILAKEFSQQWAPLSELSLDKIEEYSEIIVQTTGVGMYPDVNKNPLSFYNFKGNEILYDIIYNPELTLLMKEAQDRGARILGGYAMLEEQAKMQFRLFVSTLKG